MLAALAALAAGRHSAAADSLPFPLAQVAGGSGFTGDAEIENLPPLEGRDLFSTMGDLSVSRRQAVRRHLYLYLTTGRDFVRQAIRRAATYHPLVMQVFDETGAVPGELSLLPLLESGFSPWAVSPSRATGLWQFLPNTSRPLGLETNRWVDDRRHLEKSTRAAVRHLAYLHRVFGSWELALTAYNGGSGHVRRAMNKSGASDYWVLRETGTLSDEAREFVPRFIALALIFEHQELFGIAGEVELPESVAVSTIALDHAVPLAAVARYSGVDGETIRRYNPQLQGAITPPGERPYRLTLPSAGRDRLAGKLPELYRHRVTALREHRVRPGETLYGIAARYRNTITDILKHNRIPDPDRIRPGQVILVPVR